MEGDVKIQLIQNAGKIGDLLLESDFDAGLLRPYRDPENGGAFITNRKKEVIPVTNATLLKDEWVHLDKTVLETAKQTLNLAADLQARNLTYNLPNAMGTTVVQYQKSSDISDAQVTMDGINKSEADRQDFDLASIPIPVISKDLYFHARELAASRKFGMPLDTSNLAEATRKVSEAVEKLFSGTWDVYSFGGGTIYGYTNFPSRQTLTITDWAASSKTGTQIVQDVLNMKALSRDMNHNGPWILYVSSDYERYVEEDLKANSDITVKERILKINGITDVKTAEYLPNKTAVLVQLTRNVVDEIVGINPTTIQWETEGGMKYNFKVMAILVPRLKADYNGNTGIIHASPV